MNATTKRAIACAVAALSCTAPCLAAGPAERHAPIGIGAVSSLSGPAQFPESSAAVRAYFDSVNANGGIRGRRLELIVEHRRLHEQRGVLPPGRRDVGSGHRRRAGTARHCAVRGRDRC